jgi:quercetin dioxygenase-like cupin family protein
VIRLPLGERVTTTPTMALVKSSQLEIMRLVLTAGRSVPEHHVAGEITIQCLEGEVEIMAHGKTSVLTGGDLMFLAGGEPHALLAVKDSALLVTVVLANR